MDCKHYSKRGYEYHYSKPVFLIWAGKATGMPEFIIAGAGIILYLFCSRKWVVCIKPAAAVHSSKPKTKKRAGRRRQKERLARSCNLLLIS